MDSAAGSGQAAKRLWTQKKEDYELVKLMGIGATASVYSAVFLPTKDMCAIKRINLEKCNTNMDELLREIQAMSLCNHPNVVSYYTSFVVGDELWVVMKLLSGGSLLDVLKSRMRNMDCRHGVLDEVTIATVLKEVLKGLEYFHNNGQIHRDIKSGNILLAEDGTIQVADFGVSAWLSTGGDLSRQKVRHTFVGTPCWMAPEVMEQVTGYDFKADIWSFGILGIELATGTAPYHKYPPMKVLMLTLQNNPPTLDTSAEEKDQYKHYGKTFRKMLAECLQKDPAKRPTASELLKHSFFKKAKDKKWLVHSLIEANNGISMQSQVELSRRLAKESASKPTDDQLTATKWVFTSSESEEEDDVAAEDGATAEQSQSAVTVLVTPPQPSTTTIAVQQQKAEDEAAPQKPEVKAKSFNLVLRLRDVAGELHDIDFAFVPGVDTANGVAQELVSANLINALDASVISETLTRIINQQMESLVFPLNSYKAGQHKDEVEDEKSLTGFGQLTIRDPSAVPVAAAAQPQSTAAKQD